MHELCKAPYRKEILKDAINSKTKMFNDLREFLGGYNEILLSGIKEDSDDRNTKFLKDKLATIPELQLKLNEVETNIYRLQFKILFFPPQKYRRFYNCYGYWF